jgi:4-azaleucine resistance transporter AzlC
VRDVGALAAAAAVIGLSFGAIASAAGLPVWAVATMSLMVFAGGAQFMAVGMIAVGSPVAAVLGGLLLNARHLPFGLSIADVLRGEGRLRRLVGVHLMVDESVAFALAQTDQRRRDSAYWLTGASLFVAWNTGTLLGILLGAAVGDPMRYGLDAAFPAALIALLLPRLREPVGLRVALLGAALAVAATFVLPAGLPVLLALVGLVAAGRAPVPARRRAS